MMTQTLIYMKNDIQTCYFSSNKKSSVILQTFFKQMTKLKYFFN